MLWQKTYGGSATFQADDWGQSVCELPDGGFAIAGMTSSFGAGGWDVYVLRTDNQGDTLWTRTFGGNSDDRGYGVDVTQDNGIIVAGWAWSFDQGQGDVYLNKIFDPTIPVELTSFTATVERNSVSLNWQTATETNNYGFEIERKAPSESPLPDGQAGTQGETKEGWEKIGFISGFGTTTELHSYSFVDENLSAGVYQYSLKQIDYDGSFEYFPNAFGIEV